MMNVIGLDEQPDEKGYYSGCGNCMYDKAFYGMFGESPHCNHNPNPDSKTLFLIRDYDSPCPYKTIKVRKYIKENG